MTGSQPEHSHRQHFADGSRVVIIGGGIAGLATAALLAQDGYRVDVLEQAATVGGRAGTWQSVGFTFDTGPSWYLMPEVFDHFFELVGTSTGEQLDLVNLDPGYRVFFEGGQQPLDISASRDQNIALFERHEPGAGKALVAYLQSARQAYDLAVRRFLYTGFEQWFPLISREVVANLPRLVGLLTSSLHDFVAKRFRNPQLRQVLGYPAVFLGSSPFDAPALYHLMSHLDLSDGVRYPQGGFRTIIESIEQIARGKGATIHTSARVEAIDVQPVADSRKPKKAINNGEAFRKTGRATAVRYVNEAGEQLELEADVVISAADLHHTETRLVAEPWRTYPERYWQKRNPGPGAVLLCLGVRGKLPQLPHHSLFFTEDWQQNFDAIFGDTPRVPSPASLYVCKPSETDPSVAPEGCENLFVLIPVPADPSIGGHKDARVDRVVSECIDQIAQWAQIPDLATRIVTSKVFTPASFATDFNAWSGGVLGPAHTLRQSAFLRGSQASTNVDNLFYVGSSTIPGVGLPMCLISAEVLLKRLRGDVSAGPL